MPAVWLRPARHRFEGRPKAEYDGSGALLRRYIPGPGVDQRVAMVDCRGIASCAPGDSGVATDYYFADRQGNVLAVTDHFGAIKQHFFYTPFGVELEGDASGNPFRYTGRRYDAETGLYYYRARYYDADLGRFLQVDPVGYADQWNLYAYVGNNPLNATDPSGMIGCVVTESGQEYCPSDVTETQKSAVQSGGAIARGEADRLENSLNDLADNGVGEQHNQVSAVATVQFGDRGADGTPLPLTSDQAGTLAFTMTLISDAVDVIGSDPTAYVQVIDDPAYFEGADAIAQRDVDGNWVISIPAAYAENATTVGALILTEAVHFTRGPNMSHIGEIPRSGSIYDRSRSPTNWHRFFRRTVPGHP